MRKLTYEAPGEVGAEPPPEAPAKPKPKKAKKPAPKKKTVKKPKAKKPAKKVVKTKKAKKSKPVVERFERLDMRLSKAEKAKLVAKGKKLRRTITSIVLEAIEKIK